METKGQAIWQRNCRVFEERAEEYDQWYKNSPLFELELAAIEPLTTSLPRPRVEVGVGPGRFAARLGMDFGVDPALAALRIAAAREIIPIAGIGEQLPFADASTGTVVILFTLCFLANPGATLSECHRILRTDGVLLVGFIPARSAWGRSLAAKKTREHPFYRHVRCKTVAETLNLLDRAGFSLARGYSTLFRGPETVTEFEAPRPGLDEKAGFCVLSATRREP